jgi:pSer/pThr/pTyr-binding forkhead associated (FHA) protein
MVQLEVLSGQQAGRLWVARRFPVRVGRAPDNDLCLEDAGVFDRHLELGLENRQTIRVSVVEPALAAVNGQPVRQCPLRNGDTLELGATRLRFWLAPTSQAGLRASETIVWLTWGAVVAVQIGLIRWLNF